MWGPSSTKLRTQNIYHPIFDFHRVGYACSIYTKRSMNAKAKGISKTVSTACLKKKPFLYHKENCWFLFGTETGGIFTSTEAVNIYPG